MRRLDLYEVSALIVAVSCAAFVLIAAGAGILIGKFLL